MGNSSKWTLVNPEGVVLGKGNNVNAHPQDLEGKTVVLYWDGKPNGDILLNAISDLLAENIKDARIIKAWEVDPSTVSSESNEAASKITADKLTGLKPDIVIGAPGDCSGSTTWLVIDQLNVEKNGIPTVSIITSPYIDLAKTVPANEGFNDICLLEIPPPIGMLNEEDIHKKAGNIYPALLSAMTTWQPSSNTDKDQKTYPSTTFEFSGTNEDINRLFVENNWSLGLPVLPPTPERINPLLRGTSRKPNDILGYVPPRMGCLTVELVAVHAAMAGCLPQYMPLLITALEGLLEPAANWRMALTGTGTSQVVVIISGPIIEEIGIGFKQGAAGKGFHANASIGYAINSIAYNIGGSRPPSMDRSTLGSPADYVCWVFGENFSAMPDGWSLLHEERGFQKTDSVVTVVTSYPPIENLDHWSASPEEHIRWWSHIISPMHNMGGPSLPQIMDQNPIIILGPEHASFISSAGWKKSDFCRAFWQATSIPLSAWPVSCSREKLVEKIGPVADDNLIPVTIGPEQLLVFVAGGDGKQSHYFPPYPGSFPVSKIIKK